METEQRLCLHCKTRIDNKPAQSKYCSRFCYNDMLVEQYRSQVRAVLKELTCLQCKKNFMPNSRRQKKYCSQLCAYEYRFAQVCGSREPRDCENCGEVFKPNRSFHNFCSAKCRNQVAVMKKALGMSANEFRALHPLRTPEETRALIMKQTEANKIDVLSREQALSDLPICTKCALKFCSAHDSPYMQCDDCIKLTETESTAK